jgi:flagellar biogenesis protein FliO
MRYDNAVEPAKHEAEVEAAPSPSSAFASSPTPFSPPPSTGVELSSPEDMNSLARRLAPPSIDAAADSKSQAGDSKASGVSFAFSKLASMSTAGAGLAIVIGLFLICAWALRRNGTTPAGGLPAEAFAVLGRAPLTPQCSAHLLRLGNKLVLVAMSAEGMQPLTEVTDGIEVDRLTGLCASGRGHGPSAEFQQVLEKLSREPARGFLGAEASNRRRSYAA